MSKAIQRAGCSLLLHLPQVFPRKVFKLWSKHSKPKCLIIAGNLIAKQKYVYLYKLFKPQVVLLCTRAQFCCKMWGGQLGVKPIESTGRCRSHVLYIQIPNLISRCVLRAKLITLCLCR